MKDTIKKNIESLNKNNAPSQMSYNLFFEKIDFAIDEDFLDFIRMYNGAEGYIGNNYISFWTIEQLTSMNPYYEGNKESMELLFFATDGSNLGYAFQKKSGQIVSIDFLDIAQCAPNILAPSFELFLNNIA